MALGQPNAVGYAVSSGVDLHCMDGRSLSSGLRICSVDARNSLTGAERMRKIAAILLLLLSASPVLAHGTELHGVAATWTFDPWIVTPLAAIGLLYAVGSAVLWRGGGTNRRVRGWRATAYCAGWLSLALALTSPLHWLCEHLFFFYIIEH